MTLQKLKREVTVLWYVNLFFWVCLLLLACGQVSTVQNEVERLEVRQRISENNLPNEVYKHIEPFRTEYLNHFHKPFQKTPVQHETIPTK